MMPEPEECLGCRPPKEFLDLNILVSRFWTVRLHHNQTFLASCVIVLNRHLEDMFNISPEEREELFHLARSLRDVIRTQFKSNLFNYVSLGNVIKHLHLQVIPRYDHGVEFDNLKFYDHNWGKNFTLTDTGNLIPQATKAKIAKVIKDNLNI